jgi:DNA-binding NtrC family response regulator
MPPLRERREDIPLLMKHFVDQYARENGLAPPRFSTGALRRVESYEWPGNIRELRNFCENVAIMHSGRELTEYDLEARLSGELAVAGTGGDNGEGLQSASTLSREENEKRLLRKALMEAGGNRTRAAELMGISRRTLHRKLAQWPELDPRPASP